MKNRVLLGIDGGGTYTRVAVTDETGRLLCYVNHKGASSMHKDAKARENVEAAIGEALKGAGCHLKDILALGAGIAGFDEQEDEVWVRQLTEIKGLACPRIHVNDAVIAHSGAFYEKPGIFGITEKGRQLRNYNFGHYTGAARHLSLKAVFEMITGAADQTDGALMKGLLEHFGARDIAALADMASREFVPDYRTRMKLLGDAAPKVTDAAAQGSALARRVCDETAALHLTGIRLLGACFGLEDIPVALIGGVINSSYMKEAICRGFSGRSNRRYILTDPALPAVLGAVWMAMGQAGLRPSDEVRANLAQSGRNIAKSYDPADENNG